MDTHARILIIGLAAGTATGATFGQCRDFGGFVDLLYTEPGCLSRLAGGGDSAAAIGDINSDGLGDIAIGSKDAYVTGRMSAGRVYVLFGGGPLPAEFDLDTLDGTNGFSIDGLASGDDMGRSVAPAGDVNGDGLPDLIIGAPFADPGGRNRAGEAYVLFGRPAGSPFPARFDLATLDGGNGFKIEGVAGAEPNGDLLGTVVDGLGDLNGDGVDDLAVSAINAAPLGRDRAGEVYVVFGADAGFPAVLDPATLDGSNGFRIDGAAEHDVLGVGLAGGGDLDGDGRPDLVIGAPGIDRDGRATGGAYVIFGRGGGFPAALDLASLDPAVGTRILGDGGACGGALDAAGDVNGDGAADLIIGASTLSAGGINNAGGGYVVFGRSAASGGLPPTIELAALDGSDGFRMDGVEALGRIGSGASAAGDLNGDGFGDVALGGGRGAPGGRDYAGLAFVVFGGPDRFPAAIDLGAMTPTQGVRIEGAIANDRAGDALAPGGDIDGDGLDDLLIGAPGRRESTFVLFGRGGCRADIDGDGELTIFDFLGFQNLFDAGDPLADFDGDGELTIFDFLAFQNAFDAGC